MWVSEKEAFANSYWHELFLKVNTKQWSESCEKEHNYIINIKVPKAAHLHRITPLKTSISVHSH